MDQIRLCDIGRWNIGPTVRSVDSVLENSSEVGEKADYPVYQPCKKEPDYGVHECIESLAFAPLLYLSSLSLHDSNSTSSTLPFVASIAVTPTFARTIKNMLPPTGHYRLCSAPRHRISYLGMHTVLSRPPKKEQTLALRPLRAGYSHIQHRILSKATLRCLHGVSLSVQRTMTSDKLFRNSHYAPRVTSGSPTTGRPFAHWHTTQYSLAHYSIPRIQRTLSALCSWNLCPTQDPPKL